MHGCISQWATLGLLTAMASLGCGGPEAPPASLQKAVNAPAASDFDPARAGALEGRVTWTGSVPEVPPFEYRRNLPAANTPEPRLIRENPNAPQVDSQTRGVRGAVLMLRGLDSRKGRPWNHPQVLIEHRDRRLHVMQGKEDSQTGFVKTGSAVEIVSGEDVFNTLRADGAAFFSLTLPDLDRPRRRTLSNPGIVELSSGAGWYWMRAYLFVDEHPYYARTDSKGHYRLTGVPPGTYRLICWMPSWHIARHERDPESTVISRLYFRQPVEQEKPVEVRSGTTSTIDFIRSHVEFEE